MDKKKVPYNTQVQFAILAGKSDEAHDVIGRALAEMGNGALEFAQSYPFDDLPFVIVAMKVAVNALESMLGPNGRHLPTPFTAVPTALSLMPPSSSVRRKVATAMTDKEITGMNLVNAIYYGRNQQINHFTEELAELIQAFAEENATHIAEEIADVEIMVEQMEYLLPLDIKYIDTWAEHFAPPTDILSCIWHLAAPIKNINKLRRVDYDVANNPNMPEDEFQIRRQTAESSLETSIGELVCYLNWMKDMYCITAKEIQSVKSYKVQRTRDHIKQEVSNNV